MAFAAYILFAAIFGGLIGSQVNNIGLPVMIAIIVAAHGMFLFGQAAFK